MALYYSLPFPSFQRAMRNVFAITNNNPALVTTTFDGINPGNHDYSTGLIVSLRIPDGFGMVQANNLYAPITVVNATQFTMAIDTTDFDPFVIPMSVGYLYQTPAQVIPTGEVNDILTMACQNVLPYP